MFTSLNRPHHPQSAPRTQIAPHISAVSAERCTTKPSAAAQAAGQNQTTKGSALWTAITAVRMSGPLATVVGRRWSHGRQPTKDDSNSIEEKLPKEELLASGKGIDVYICLVESVLFLRGFEEDTSAQHTVVLRGRLHLHITKRTKIKAVTLEFHGKATTTWPKGDCPTFPVYARTLNQHKAFLLRGSGFRRQIRLSTTRGRFIALKPLRQRVELVRIILSFSNGCH